VACALAPRTTELLRVGARAHPHRTHHRLRSDRDHIHAAQRAELATQGPPDPRLLAELAAGSHPPPASRRAPAPARRRLPTRNTHGQPHLPSRDEALARTEHFLADTLASIDHDPDRRLIATFATWRVLRRLWHRAEQHPRPRGRFGCKTEQEPMAWAPDLRFRGVGVAGFEPTASSRTAGTTVDRGCFRTSRATGGRCWSASLLYCAAVQLRLRAGRD